MLHKALGDDPRHNLIGVPDALAALEAERVGERGGKVGRLFGREFTGVGSGRKKERGGPPEGSAGVIAMRIT